MDLIFTEDKLLISRTPADWRLWQNYFSNYKASLTFNNASELIEYLKFDYKLSDTNAEKVVTALSDKTSPIIELVLPTALQQFAILATDFVMPTGK